MDIYVQREKFINKGSLFIKLSNKLKYKKKNNFLVSMSKYGFCANLLLIE